MKDHDSITERAIKEAAEILAKGYMRLMMKQSEGPRGVAAGENAVPAPKPA